MAVGAYPGETEVRHLRTLYKLLTSLSRAETLDDVYQAAIGGLLEATSAERAAILTFDDDGVIQFRASRGLSAEYQAAVTGHSPWKAGVRDAVPIVVPDIRTDADLAPYGDVMAREGIRSVAFLPLAFQGGLFGKFMLYYGEPHERDNDEIEVAQAIGAHVALATEHKRAALATVATEQRLQAILDNSPAVIFVKDLQGRYQLTNQRYQDLFHVGRQQVMGKTDFDLFPREMAERFRVNDQAVLAAGHPMVVEELAPHDDGVHTYISTKFPIYGTDGQPAGVCGIATDITERKQLELARHHLAAVVESTDDAIITKNLNGIITSWNKGAERIFGYKSDETIGQPVAMLAPPDHQDEIPDILSKIRQGLRVEHYDTRRRRKDGRIIDVSLTVSPMRDSTGRIIGASKIARDVTERKEAEQSLAVHLSREQEARRTAELLNTVGPRLGAQLDLQKLVQEVSDLATALVGAEFGSFFHNVINEKGESYMLYTLSGVPREAFSKFPMPRNTDLFGATFRGEGIVRCDDVTQDPRYGKNAPHHGMPQGHLPVKSYLAAPVISRSGEVIGGLFFGHSVPDRFTASHEAIIRGIAAQAAIAMDNARLFEQGQHTQSDLQRSNEELRRLNRDLEVFSYSASHDLQEPLRTIALSAELIDRTWGQKLEGEDAAFLKNIRNAVRHMDALLKDLLAYTRATKYEQGPAQYIEARRALEQVLENMKGTLEETGATVNSGELPAVDVHEGRLIQLFQNLISNAIKYRSKEAPRVHITAEKRDGWCIFSVADNGIGIDPRFAEQIFGLFKRLHSREEYPGSGVGLAICQRVVEQYGGRIWLAESALGRGSTFSFSLPARN